MILIIFLTAIGPSYAISDIHNNLDKTTGKSECVKCHSSHQVSIPVTPGIDTINNLRSSQTQIIQPLAVTEVIGNITLIPSIGQNWYQQGIYGPNASGNVSIDKSWGWTFFDENPSSGFTTPPEKVIQRNKIYAFLLDSGNNSTPINGALVTANVTYWLYNGSDYTNETIQVQLTEDTNHSGFYAGNFHFYGGTPYAGYGMDWCDGCHLSYYTSAPDSQLGYFPGNYTVTILATSGNKNASAQASFEVTPWGCEDCHGSGDQHRRNKVKLNDGDMDSACYLCHGKNFGTDAGNPHQNTAHRNISCTGCHTNKSLNQQGFNGVTFIQGGINNGMIPKYDNVTIPLNSGTHSNLTCEECHNDLLLPETQGNFKADNYTIRNTVNNFIPGFTTIQQFQDYYVINVTNVTSGSPLDITLDWEGASNIGFYLYPPNFNPRNRTDQANPDNGERPYYNGSTYTNKPEYYKNDTPKEGKWILSVYGYNLTDGVGTLQGPLNYTINSTYPIEQKNFPKIPECNSCHNSNATGKASTTDNIPDWNPGFAHVDINKDGIPDIQCRMCHDALHEITVKDCHNCHTTAPSGHPVKEPDFAQKTPFQCLGCHGDPHKVTLTGGTDCIGCHVPNDVNTTRFARHANLNTSDGDNNVTNNDCWTCHYQKDMNRSHVYLCESCHSNSSGIVQVTDPLLIKSDFMHGMTICKSCHAPVTYHSRGTVGPLGAVENIIHE